MARIVENIKDSAAQQAAHTEHVPFEGLKASHSSGQLLPHRKKRFSFIIIMMAVLAFIALGGAVFSFLQLQDAEKDAKKNPKVAEKQQVSSIVNKVKKLIDVPKNETPSIVNVEDATKLKSQSFFTNVKNGDTILLYTKAKKAIIYRESTNKIINVGPFDLSGTEDTGTTETTSE
ncbi:MAG TPA: hypothetical protein PKB15_05245 [Acidimicrobiia bacterium]|nr:hypothetical protein [Acidimicrobiia bacterium]